ncbi:MAG: hypothetical protein WC919_00090 [Candidatus Paceibacterota bacterium]|jgi:hypothetical protein
MITKEQVLQEVFEMLISPAVACTDTMSVYDKDHKTPIKTATGWHDEYTKGHHVEFNMDGTAVTTIDGIEYKLKMTVEIVSEKRVEE